MIRTGNAGSEAGLHRGWILGHFMPLNDPGHTRNVEIKWMLCQKGEGREEWSSSELGTTIGILVRGRMVQHFRDRDVVLEAEGDYVIFGPGEEHTWTALENNTLVIAVRWPSCPG